MTEQVQRARPWSAEVIGALLVRTSARIGLAWIAVLVAAAVFAPWIANSHPLYLVVDGEVSFPAMRHLTAAAFTLFGGFILAIFAWRFRGAVFFRFGGWFLRGANCRLIAWVWVAAAAPVIHEQYRELEASGRIDF